MQSRNGRQAAVSAATRWLQRRQREGVFESETDTLPVLQHHATTSTSATTSDNNNNNLALSNRIPESVLSFRPPHEVPSLLRAVMRSRLRAAAASSSRTGGLSFPSNSTNSSAQHQRQQQSDDDDEDDDRQHMEEVLSRYVALTNKLLGSAQWKDAVRCFCDAVVSSSPSSLSKVGNFQQWNKNLKQQQERTPQFARLWVDLCRNDSECFPSSTSNKNKNRSTASTTVTTTTTTRQDMRNERLALLMARAAISAALQPLCPPSAARLIQTECVDPLARQRAALLGEARSVVAAMSHQVGQRQWVDALRLFVPNWDAVNNVVGSDDDGRKVSNNNKGKKKLVGDSDDDDDVSAVENAALYCLKYSLGKSSCLLVSSGCRQKDGVDDDFALSAVVGSSPSSSSNQIISSKNSNKNQRLKQMRTGFDTAFLHWCSRSVDVQLTVAKEFCSQYFRSTPQRQHQQHEDDCGGSGGGDDEQQHQHSQQTVTVMPRSVQRILVTTTTTTSTTDLRLNSPRHFYSSAISGPSIAQIVQFVFHFLAPFSNSAAASTTMMASSNSTSRGVPLSSATTTAEHDRRKHALVALLPTLRVLAALLSRKLSSDDVILHNNNNNNNNVSSSSHNTAAETTALLAKTWASIASVLSCRAAAEDAKGKNHHYLRKNTQHGVLLDFEQLELPECAAQLLAGLDAAAAAAVGTRANDGDDDDVVGVIGAEVRPRHARASVVHHSREVLRVCLVAVALSLADSAASLPIFENGRRIKPADDGSGGGGGLLDLSEFLLPSGMSPESHWGSFVLGRAKFLLDVLLVAETTSSASSSTSGVRTQSSSPSQNDDDDALLLQRTGRIANIAANALCFDAFSAKLVIETIFSLQQLQQRGRGEEDKERENETSPVVDNERLVEFLRPLSPWLLRNDGKALVQILSMAQTRARKEEEAVRHDDGDKKINTPTSIIASSSVVDGNLWKLAVRAFAFQTTEKEEGSSSRSQQQTSAASVTTRALLACGMWRAAIAVAPRRQAPTVCDQVLSAIASVGATTAARPLQHQLHRHQQQIQQTATRSNNNNNNQQWLVAVGLLAELSRRELQLKPRALMLVLKVLDAPTAPSEISVDLTIQMGGGGGEGHGKRNQQQSQEVQEQQQEVVNLLVSVTRAVLRDDARRSFGGEQDKEAEEEQLQQRRQQSLAIARARVHALSNLLSLSSTSPEQAKRRHARSLRSAMLLCADAGDWQSALFLISTASEKAPGFTLAPDVVWRVAAALESAGHGDRADALKGFLASRDVAQWLESDDSNLDDDVGGRASFPVSSSFSTRRRSSGAEHDYYGRVGSNNNNHTRGEVFSDDSASQSFPGGFFDNDDDIVMHFDNNNNNTMGGGGGEQDVIVESSDGKKVMMMRDGVHLDEFIRSRCSHVQRISAAGQWHVATSLLVQDVLPHVIASTGSHPPRQPRPHLGGNGSNNKTKVPAAAAADPVLNAFVSVIKVCTLRRHWQQALDALRVAQRCPSSFDELDRPPLRPETLSRGLAVLVLKCLCSYGRWREATTLFSINNSLITSPPPQQQQQQQRDDNKMLTTHHHSGSSEALRQSCFAQLIRACQLSRNWLAALRLHHLQPGLVTFWSVSEVVGACSACGFPLTKIQLWLSLSKVSMFLASSSYSSSSSLLFSKSSSLSANGGDNTTTESKESSVVGSDDGDENGASSSSTLLSAVDVSVFFALLNAQCHQQWAGNSNSNSNRTSHQSRQTQLQQGAPLLPPADDDVSHHNETSTTNSRDGIWMRSLQLLQACWSRMMEHQESSSTTLTTDDVCGGGGIAAAARSPDCVTSVIDTCLRLGRWQEAFAVYSMQRMLQIPSTPYSVQALLTEMHSRLLESNRRQQQLSSSTTTPLLWQSACRLVSDAVVQRVPNVVVAANNQHEQQHGGVGYQNSSGIRMRPLLCEKLVQVMCLGGQWERGLAFAVAVGPSMGNLMSNDRVLDTLVYTAGGNPRVVVRAALGSGSFPVSPNHAMGKRVVRSAIALLDQQTSEDVDVDVDVVVGGGEDQTRGSSSLSSSSSSSSSSPWKVALEALTRCVHVRDMAAADRARMLLAALRRGPNQRRGDLSREVVASMMKNMSSSSRHPHHQQHDFFGCAAPVLNEWICQATARRHDDDDKQDDGSGGDDALSPAKAADLAFAHIAANALVDVVSKSSLRGDNNQHKSKGDALLRYSLLFGVPTVHELKVVWPNAVGVLVAECSSRDPEHNKEAPMLMDKVVSHVKSVLDPICEEIP